jgi:hypothetical protein
MGKSLFGLFPPFIHSLTSGGTPTRTLFFHPNNKQFGLLALPTELG